MLLENENTQHGPCHFRLLPQALSDAAGRQQALEARMESRLSSLATSLGRYEAVNADLRRRLEVSPSESPTNCIV